jgi:hypothetical protein
MTGYAFVYGVDGFGADTAPALEEGVYLDFDKAFEHLVKLNHKAIKSGERYFYEDGYGEDTYPEDDVELSQAENNEDWVLFETLLCKHIIQDEIEINKLFINIEEPYFGMYAIQEVEIKK